MGNGANGVQPPVSSAVGSSGLNPGSGPDGKLSLDGLNAGFAGLGPYPAGQYQHLLVAN